ncbi:hypothetical protein D1007_35961 [Hordeum vulgare]|nr:hypothetical protein D1007_35961 [Hordeum vulgare]
MVTPPLALHPLDLIDDDKLCSWDRKCRDAFSNILTTHTGQSDALPSTSYVQTARLNPSFTPNYKVEPKFHEWFLSPDLDQLEELRLAPRHGRPLPPAVLRLAPTLRCATFMECFFHQINIGIALHLPKLKYLELIDISMSKEDLDLILCGCNVLE